MIDHLIPILFMALCFLAGYKIGIQDGKKKAYTVVYKELRKKQKLQEMEGKNND